MTDVAQGGSDVDGTDEPATDGNDVDAPDGNDVDGTNGAGDAADGSNVDAADGAGDTADEEATVLVVDDEQHVLDLYADWLDPAYEIRTAANGREALDLVDETVDMILLDRRMPEVSGDEVLAEIRRAGHDCWVVMVTAVEPDVGVVEMGFDEYIVKPVGKGALLEMVEGVLARETYDEKLQNYMALTAKLGVLESAHSRAELAEHEEYAALREEHERIKNDLDETIGQLLDTDEYDKLFLDRPDS